MYVALRPSFRGTKQLYYATFSSLNINIIQYRLVYLIFPSTHNIDFCHWNYCCDKNYVNCSALVSLLFEFLLHVSLPFF
jgi:hypothetical protein